MSMFKLFEEADPSNQSDQELLMCLQFIMDELGINKADRFSIKDIYQGVHKGIHSDDIQNLTRGLDIVLQKLTTTTIKELSGSFYPILLELESEQRFRVLVRSKNHCYVIYNPYQQTIDRYDQTTVTRDLKFINSWQCFPCQLFKLNRYVHLIQFIFYQYPKDILKIISLGMFAASGVLVLSITSASIMSHIQETDHYCFSIQLLSLFLFILASLTMTYINDINHKSLTTKILIHIIPSLMKHILSLPLNLVKRTSSADLVQSLFDFSASLLSSIVIGWSIFYNSIVLLLLLGYMFYCSIKLALMYFIICLLVFVIKIIVLHYQHRLILSKLKINGETASFLSDVLLQIHKIRTSGFERNAIQQWLSRQIQIKQLEKKATRLDIFIMLLESLLPTLLFILLCAALKTMPDNNRMMMILPFMISANQFNMVFEQLSFDIVRLMYLVAGFKRIQPLLSLPAEQSPNLSSTFKSGFDSAGISRKKEIQSIKQIKFNQVQLIADETHKIILNNISMTITTGSFVGIIGASGAGKSSIFRLILGFEKASAGTILIDENNIHDTDLTSFRRQLGVVLQTTNILPGSIYSNIAANTHLSLAEAWHLADVVGLAEEIDAMPMKMHTYISDNAMESLSGGQKQKILIARALASRPKILLLDEATSALDNISQARIYDHLNKINITRVVIAHRYNSFTHADIIYVLEEGKIIHQGTYQELLNNKIIAR